MVQPAYILNTRNQSMDILVDPATGTLRTKIAVGNAALSGLTPAGAWEGVATHVDGGAFGATDGVVVIAGVNSTDDVVRASVDADGKIVMAASAYGGALTDISGTLTTGATSEEIAAANPSRRYLFIQNLHATEDLWINFGVAAVQSQPSIKLPGGGSFVMEAGFCSTQAVHVIATTIAHAWTAKEG